jgi:hypothetical protein
LHAWIALVAFVFGLFAPALSQPFAPPDLPAHATEICTAAGMVMMPIAASPDDPGAGMASGMTHCDVCCSHQAQVALPSQAELPLLLIDARDTYPRLFYQSPSPQFAWAPAQSRAPPASFS